MNQQNKDEAEELAKSIMELKNEEKKLADVNRSKVARVSVRNRSIKSSLNDII